MQEATSLENQFDLDGAETRLWTGAPRQGIILRPGDAFAIPVGVLWTAGAVFWEASVLRTQGPGIFALFGLPFVLIGLHVTVGRFIADAWRRRKTRYALTSDRVIIGTGSNVTSLFLSSLGDITLTEGKDGSGTITFRPPIGEMVGAARPSVAQIVSAPMFQSIPAARRVYEKIRNAQHSSIANVGAVDIGAAYPSDTAPARVGAPIRATASTRVTTTTQVTAPVENVVGVNRRSFGVLFDMVFIGGLASFMAYAGATSWYYGTRSVNWPVAAAVVRNSEVVRSSPSGSDTRTHYSARVSYEYRVGDRTFVGHRISYGSLSYGNGAREAERLVARYPPGAVVQAHYDAAQPDRSVLQVGWTGGSLMMVSLCLFGLLFALGLYRLWTKPSRAR